MQDTTSQDYLLADKKSVTIRLEQELIDQIDKLRDGTERNRTQQIAFMLKKYLLVNEK